MMLDKVDLDMMVERQDDLEMMEIDRMYLEMTGR